MCITGDPIGNAYRFMNLLLQGQAVDAQALADHLGTKTAAARPYIEKSRLIDGVAISGRPASASLRRQHAEGPTDDQAIAACFAASLAAVFEGSKYAPGMRDALGHVTRASPDPAKFHDLARKF